MDLFDPGVAGEPPECLRDSCPSGATSVEAQCVSPTLPGQAREIAVTLHLECATCAQDGGVELSGQVWMAVAQLLRVPLQETAVAVLMSSPSLRAKHTLEHFTLAVQGEQPLIPAARGSPGQISTSLELFMAVRVHTARVPEGADMLQALRRSDSAPLRYLLEMPGISIFEYAEMPVFSVRAPYGLVAKYRFVGNGWNEQPLSRPSSSPSTSPGPTPTRLTTSTSTSPSVTPSPSNADCYDWSCRSYMIGDGFCDQSCLAACGHDGGDCETTTTKTSSTTSPPAPTGAPCGCNVQWLGDGICDSYCNTERCDYDRGDCGTIPAPAPLPSTDSNSGSQQAIPGSSSTTSAQGNLRGGGSSNGQAAGANVEDTSPHLIGLRTEEVDDSGSWRVVASDQTSGAWREWYVDEPRETGPESSDTLVGIVIGGLCMLGSFTFVLIVCRMVRDAQARAAERQSKGTAWTNDAPSPIGRQSIPTPSSWHSNGTAWTPTTPLSQRWGEKFREVKVHPQSPVSNTRHSSKQQSAPAQSQPRPPPVPPHLRGRQWTAEPEAEPTRSASKQSQNAQRSASASRPARPEARAQETPQSRTFSGEPEPEPQRPRQQRQPTAAWAEDTRKSTTQHSTRTSARKATAADPSNDGTRSSGGLFSWFRASQSERAPAKDAQERPTRRNQEPGPKTSCRNPHRNNTAPPSARPPKNSFASQAQSGWTRGWGRAKTVNPQKHSEGLIADMLKDLETARNAPLPERKKVFRDLQRRLHPDKNMDSPEVAEAAKLAFQRLMEQKNSYLT